MRSRRLRNTVEEVVEATEVVVAEGADTPEAASGVEHIQAAVAVLILGAEAERLIEGARSVGRAE